VHLLPNYRHHVCLWILRTARTLSIIVNTNREHLERKVRCIAGVARGDKSPACSDQLGIRSCTALHAKTSSEKTHCLHAGKSRKSNYSRGRLDPDRARSKLRRWRSAIPNIDDDRSNLEPAWRAISATSEKSEGRICCWSADPKLIVGFERGHSARETKATLVPPTHTNLPRHPFCTDAAQLLVTRITSAWR
jgi:hypothetical protein